MSEKTIGKDIKKYVLDAKGKKFNSILATDNRFEVFYHLSETRKSLFNWYDFKEKADILEIGGEYGAITGLLCEKAANVTSVVETDEEAEIIRLRHGSCKNLEVLIGKAEELTFGKQFDYIILVEKLEYLCGGYKGLQPYIELLKKLTSNLKEDGTLLIAVDNRYGLRYFCGEEDPITHRPFYGLNRYPGGSEGYLFSRQELIEMIHGIPGMELKMYYPLPDFRFPQLIYSDRYLPDKNIKERLQSYTRNPGSLVLNELRVYDDLVANNVFPFFSNSFLLECNKKGDFDKAIYAALSTDRGEEHGYATVIREDETVKKIALYPAGENALEILQRNIEDMQMHGVCVVPHTKTGNEISMQQMQFPTLSTELKRVIKTDSKRFVELFDMLYHEVLKSSEEVSLESSECHQINPEEAYWGPILKRAYIDMIPINCFINGNELIFFDQEFVRDNYPAGYTMYRAIKYTYLFMPFAEEIIPIQTLKERFGLIQTWNYYAEIEKDFVADNRDYQTYGSFTEWCRRNTKEIVANIEKLMEK